VRGDCDLAASTAAQATQRLPGRRPLNPPPSPAQQAAAAGPQWRSVGRSPSYTRGITQRAAQEHVSKHRKVHAACTHIMQGIGGHRALRGGRLRGASLSRLKRWWAGVHVGGLQRAAPRRCVMQGIAAEGPWRPRLRGKALPRHTHTHRHARPSLGHAQPQQRCHTRPCTHTAGSRSREAHDVSPLLPPVQRVDGGDGVSS
jgi:hypothetical protein